MPNKAEHTTAQETKEDEIQGEAQTLAPTSVSLKRETPISWLIRVLKGALVGIGAILPGLSGGVLMVIFGIYEPLLDFLANFIKKFKHYFFYFVPIGIGGILGIILFAGAVSAAFGTYAAQFISLFIGFVAGTVPSIWRTAGLKGRSTGEYTALVIASLAILVFMLQGEQQMTSVEPNFLVWIGSGVLVGLGFIVPGLSPSNFLIYFGLYSQMTDGISALELGVIVPLMLGVLISALLFAKLVGFLFERFYGIMYHIILGTVIGSSIAIFPTVVAPGLSPEGLVDSGLSFILSLIFIVVMFVLGLIASLLFSKLEKRYSPEQQGLR